MKKNIVLLLLLTLSWGCNDEAFLTKEPKNLLLDEQIFKDKTLVLSVLGDLYGRLPDYQSIRDWGWYIAYGDFDEAFISSAGEYGHHQNNGYGIGSWGYWDYAYIREINLFIQKCEKADQLAAVDRDRFLAEARFIRAFVYFELVKRMGGVPLLTEPLTYVPGTDPEVLRHPRAKEEEVYKFVIDEMDAIKSILPIGQATKSRASQGAALAMKTRAALYAASIAKYGNLETPTVSLPGGEVGIPASKANEYYDLALKTAQEIITSNQYALYINDLPVKGNLSTNNPADLQKNFSNVFLNEDANQEAIFVEDFKVKSGKVTPFTISNQPRYQAEEQEGGRINPTLNLVQSFEKLDKTFAPLTKTNAASLLVDSNDKVLYFDNPQDLFADRDNRLGGTVILPGTTFKGKEVDIWAGYIKPDNSIVTAPGFGGFGDLDGNPSTPNVQVVGFSGPIPNLEFSAQTGFYIRKYLDPSAGSGQRGTQGGGWFIRYRYAEVLLNAAEAAFELGNTSLAADYLNQVRHRAGFAPENDLTSGEVNFDRIVHERKVELSFEGHELWDYKRWRIAHKVFNGSGGDLTSNPGSATAPSTKPFALWPYRFYAPGNPNDGKWVFKRVNLDQATGRDQFVLANYYSEINNDIINRNPLIKKNPLQ